MIDKNVVSCDGFISCRSAFYTARVAISNLSSYQLFSGNNWLAGEIDSGNWAVSYLLSMYNHRSKDFILFEKPTVFVNNRESSLDEISQTVCYFDYLDPLFSKKESVKEMVAKGLNRTGLGYSVEEVRNLFQIDKERFVRPLTGVGHEIFKAMGAISFSNEKEIICFPWMSKKLFDSYCAHLTHSIQILQMEKKMIAVPVGY